MSTEDYLFHGKSNFDFNSKSPKLNVEDYRHLVGKSINVARIIYPNIREVTKDGHNLDVTEEFVTTRLNVETRNNIIVGLVSFS